LLLLLLLLLSLSLESGRKCLHLRQRQTEAMGGVLMLLDCMRLVNDERSEVALFVITLIDTETGHVQGVISRGHWA